MVRRRTVGRLAGFVGEESAGASFLRRDGTVWTTDKDGIIAGAAGGGDDGARLGATPARSIADLTREFGDPVYERIDAPATHEQKAALGAALRRSRSDAASWPASRSGRF